MFREKSLSTVMLGHAWSMATQKGRDADAAAALKSFIEKNPTHSDIASAAELCVRELQASGDEVAAEAMASRLLMRWGQSNAAKKLVRRYTSATSSDMPESVKRWLLGQALPDRLKTLDAPTSAAALLVVIEEEQTDLVDPLVDQLAASDQSGQSVSDALQRLGRGEKRSDR